MQIFLKFAALPSFMLEHTMWRDNSHYDNFFKVIFKILILKTTRLRDNRSFLFQNHSNQM